MTPIKILLIAPAVTTLLLVNVSAVLGQTVDVETAVRSDISSQPLRTIQPLPRAEGAFLREHRVRKLPLPQIKALTLADNAVQKVAAAALPIGPVKPFAGVGAGNYTISGDPPDTNGSVGKSYYVQWVNTGLAAFDKTTGQPSFGPIDGNFVWRGFGGNCEQYNDGDPIVLYDKAADRWLLTQFAVSGTPFSQCFAVSTSSDPGGTYARYEFQFKDFNDYPKFGVWPDGYYGTFNMFQGNEFLGAKACAFERSKMLRSEKDPRMACVDLSGQGGVLPSDLDGITTPPVGSPNYLLNFGSNSLNLWRFHVDWANPSTSTLTGPVSIKTAPFEVACRSSAVVGECIKQPNGQLLDSLSDRLMFRLAYRNFNDHESLTVDHSVGVGNSSGLRWYELRDPGGSPKIYQQGTYAPGSEFRWMGSLAMDKAGDMLLGYSVTGTRVFPSIRFAGRSASDPLNRLSAEQEITKGSGAQESPERWGDYASVSIDPTDDCTFWFTTQYMANTGSYNWSTSIVPIRFKACH